jgi:hypothetical protein
VGKHSPNRFGGYLSTHTKIMDKWIRDGFVVSDSCTFMGLGENYLLLEGAIECAGGLLYIDVWKLLQVLEGTGPNALVQTIDYHYVAVLKGRGIVFRYDGPHDHRRMHHVHRFAVLEDPEVETLIELDEDGWPTLGEVITEFSKWYYDNYDKIEVARREIETRGL